MSTTHKASRTIRHRSLMSLAIIAALALVLSSCGSDDADDTTDSVDQDSTGQDGMNDGVGPVQGTGTDTEGDGMTADGMGDLEEEDLPPGLDGSSDTDMALPEDFPSDVTLIDGDIFSVDSTEDQGERQWNVHVRIVDELDGMENARQLLLNDGFDEAAWNVEDRPLRGEFVTDDHQVSVQSMTDADGSYLAYSVSTTA